MQNICGTWIHTLFWFMVRLIDQYVFTQSYLTTELCVTGVSHCSSNVKLSSSPEPSELWKLSNYLLLCGPIPSVHLCFLSLIHFVSSRTPAACFSLRPVHHLWVSPVLLILHHFISLSLCMLTHAHWIGCQGVMHYCFHGNRMAVSPCYRSRHSTF